MVQNKRNLCLFSYLDSAIFPPSKIKLALVPRSVWKYFLRVQFSFFSYRIEKAPASWPVRYSFEPMQLKMVGS